VEVSGAREGEDVGSAGQSHASKLLGGSERGTAVFVQQGTTEPIPVATRSVRLIRFGFESHQGHGCLL